MDTTTTTPVAETSAVDASATQAVENQTTATPSSTESTPAAVEKTAEPISKSLRDVISESFDKMGGDPKTEVAPKTALPKQDGVPETAPVAATDKPVDPISGRVLEPIKAPAGMPPAIREKWGTLDRTVQQYWTDRERDIQQTLSKTDNERKLASEFKEIAAPYEPMLRQFNLTAAQHAKELFNLSYTLNNGTPQTKAQVLYNLITHFKPDPATLQSLFAGQSVPQVAQTAQQQQPVNVQEEVKKALEARKQEEERQSVESAVTSFANDPAHEFYADVAHLMGKIIDAELVSGKDYPELFKNAYSLACQQHPEIKQILDTRAKTNPQVAQVSTTSGQTAKAVPSVKPSLNGGTRSKVPAKNMSVREAAEMAWANLEGKN